VGGDEERLLLQLRPVSRGLLGIEGGERSSCGGRGSEEAEQVEAQKISDNRCMRVGALIF
jgi:hypothetical protein